ncbi:MAG: hypothetical protein KGQ89_06635 [Verrucomicrobia bacterium]|nr:hypothetical protein [Verrucomicrobiota bacterium]
MINESRAGSKHYVCRAARKLLPAWRLDALISPEAVMTHKRTVRVFYFELHKKHNTIMKSIQTLIAAAFAGVFAAGTAWRTAAHSKSNNLPAEEKVLCRSKDGCKVRKKDEKLEKRRKEKSNFVIFFPSQVHSHGASKIHQQSQPGHRDRTARAALQPHPQRETGGGLV